MEFVSVVAINQIHLKIIYLVSQQRFDFLTTYSVEKRGEVRETLKKNHPALEEPAIIINTSQVLLVSLATVVGASIFFTISQI